MREYEVATFWWPRGTHTDGAEIVYREGDILTYTQYRNPRSGGGQRLYKVAAETRAKACAEARRLRAADGP